MKMLYVIPALLVLVPVVAADTRPFPLTPLKLELPVAAQPASDVPLRLENIQPPPVIDYGLSLPAGEMRAPRFNLDSPGPGYRDQQAKMNAR